MDLRCEKGVKFAELNGNILEVKCRSRWCGVKRGVVVIHLFDIHTGRQVGTRKYRDPVHERK